MESIASYLVVHLSFVLVSSLCSQENNRKRSTRRRVGLHGKPSKSCFKLTKYGLQHTTSLSALPNDGVKRSGFPAAVPEFFSDATVSSHIRFKHVQYEQEYTLKWIMHGQHLQRHTHRQWAKQASDKHHHVFGRCGGEPAGSLHPRGSPEGTSLQVVCILHPGDRLGPHWPAGHLHPQPDCVHLLRPQRVPDQPGWWSSVQALRLRHEFLWPGANTHPVRYGRGALSRHQPSLLLLRAHSPQLCQNHPFLYLSFFFGFLPPAIRRLRQVPAVLSRDMVLHWHDCDSGWPGQLGTGLLPVLLLSHGTVSPSRICVQRLGYSKPVPDAPEPGNTAGLCSVHWEKTEAESGVVRTGRGRDGPPGAAGTHHCYLCRLLPATHCKFTLFTQCVCVRQTESTVL